MYDTLAQKPQSMVQPGMNLGVPERVRYDGQVVIPLDEERVREAVRLFKANGVNAVAVATLFSFLNAKHEKQGADSG